MRTSGWTAVIVNYNGASFLPACIVALQRTQTPPADIVVVDNASSDDSLVELHAYPRVHVLAQNTNLGFAGGANVGLGAVESDLALILNPDVEVDEQFGSSLERAFAADPRLGAAGSLLFYPDSDRIQHAGGRVDYPLMTTHHHGYGLTDSAAYVEPTDVDFVTGGAIGLRCKAIDSIGGFDEAFAPVYYEDVDLCYRLRANGWNVRLVPAMRGFHHEGVTLNRSDAYYRHLHRNRIRFALKHLSTTQWKYDFVPAEFDRLRHELASLSHPDAVTISGLDAIEATLRGIDDVRGWQTEPLTRLWPTPSKNIASAATLLHTPYPPQFDPSKVSRISRFLNTVATRWYVDPRFDRQQQFNQAILDALNEHDQHLREQTAALILFALDAIGMLTTRPKSEETTSLQAE